MTSSDAKGLRARFEEFKRKRRHVTVEADVQIERGPNPALILLVGVVALVLAVAGFALDQRSTRKVNDRAVRVQAAVVGGAYLNSGAVDVDVTFEYEGITRLERVRLDRRATIPTTLTLMIDPHHPSHPWLRGDRPPRPWSSVTFGAGMLGAFGAWTALGVAWRLQRRRRRLKLSSDSDIRRCTVLADAVGDVEEVPREFVIPQTTLGRTFVLEVIFLAVMLVGFGVAWAFASPPTAFFAVLWIVMVVASMVVALRWRRSRVVVTDGGFLVRGIFDQRQYAWSDIAAASVVRRQPWRYGLKQRNAKADYLMVRVEAVLITHDGARVPAAAANRVSGEGSLVASKQPKAEMLVRAWSQHTRGKTTADRSDAFAWR